MTTIITEPFIRIGMRDHAQLAATVWRPSTSDHTPVPVLLARTPYNRHVAAATYAPERLAAAGYAVVIQDCRGRFDSEGEWSYVTCEVDDGYDSVEWAAAQPWSNGRVGMFGASYMGYTQWLAAIARPPHLVTIVPEACTDDYWVACFDTGGAFRMGLRIGWTVTVIAEMAEQWGIADPLLDEVRRLREQTRAAATDETKVRALREQLAALLVDVYRARPFTDHPLFRGRATWLAEIFGSERRHDAHWLSRNPSTYYRSIDIPVLNIGGWYDIHLHGTIGNFTGMREQAPSPRARENQRLIVGPWTHWTTGPPAPLGMTKLRLEWFGRWLQDARSLNTAPVAAPVRIFVMGRDEWRDEHEWPLARTVFTPWYLHAEGRLSPTPPPGASTNATTNDAFTYDPHDPVPTLGGRLFSVGEVAGPFDQRALDERADVLRYQSDALQEPLEITGPVQLELWASTDAPDTDFTARLIDVHPDGTAINLCEGIVRARHASIAMPLVAGAVYHFTIDLWATSVELAPGHRLRVDISSSSFPEWEPNPNTGAPVGTDRPEDVRVAHQIIHRDAAHPSHLVVPVIPSVATTTTVP